MYSRNIGKMISICYRYTANRQLAEDLAHDAFLKAMDKAESFEGRGHFEAWLRKIVVNQALQYLRDQKKKKQTDDWLQHERSAVPTEDQEHTYTPDPAELSEQELLEAIHALPEHHRLVFNLYVIDNFTHHQIGEELGISEGTSKSHLARARKKLRQLLTEKASQRPDRKRTLLLLLFPKHIDSLYRKYFNPLAMVKAPAVIAWSTATVATSVGIILTAVWIVPPQQSRQQASKPLVLAAPAHVNVDSTTATISSNRVILNKNTNHTSMKKLDSIGAILLASTSIMFDTTAQTTTKKDVPAVAEQTESVTAKLSKQVDTTSFPSARPFIYASKTKKQKGTFTATSLRWSSKNNELYFEGVVKVDVGQNDFQGDGTFTFLGPVYLVMVNDTPAEHDTTIKLAQQTYSLTTLNETEATDKYGEKGRHGAIEISTTK